jgi:DNA-binding MarR family transcriptional regulator
MRSFGLVETRVNPHEMRRHEVYLTPKGRALAQNLTPTVEIDETANFFRAR